MCVVCVLSYNLGYLQTFQILLKIGCALVGISRIFQIVLCVSRVQVIKRKEMWQENKYFEKSPFPPETTVTAYQWLDGCVSSPGVRASVPGTVHCGLLAQQEVCCLSFPVLCFSSK